MRAKGKCPGLRISIHALRVEGDLIRAKSGVTINTISIHALRVEGDKATSRRCSKIRDFYPRPPGGGRLSSSPQILLRFSISIHALRVEGDSKNGQSFRLFLRKREKNLPL